MVFICIVILLLLSNDKTITTTFGRFLLLFELSHPLCGSFAWMSTGCCLHKLCAFGFAHSSWKNTSVAQLCKNFFKKTKNKITSSKCSIYSFVVTKGITIYSKKRGEQSKRKVVFIKWDRLIKITNFWNIGLKLQTSTIEFRFFNELLYYELDSLFALKRGRSGVK